MKISKLYIHDFQQFSQFELDFTDPKTGLPLDKVCLIGRNGTGKSTLLSLTSTTLQAPLPAPPPALPTCFGIRLEDQEQVRWLSVKCPSGSDNTRTILLTSTDKDLQNYLERGLDVQSLIEMKHLAVSLPLNSFDPLVFCPADDPVLVSGLPRTQLNSALPLFEDFPAYHQIGGGFSANFWNLLIYQIKKRESDWEEFLKLPANGSRTVTEVRKQFDQEHPEILEFLARKWDDILGPAGLFFDYEHAKKPVQLSDNLQAYVKLLSGKVLDYGALSTGIRNYLFKIGHIASLYFGREVKSGLILFDEPENSLYPDFLYDLIGNFLSVVRNTQLIVATHSPIIAAQFKPEERFILDFDSEHKVTCRRGTTPEGDDPNDILEKDFAVRSLYGPAGIRSWERFLDLRSKIQTERDMAKKRELMTEFLRLGNDYNFALKNAIPEKAS